MKKIHYFVLTLAIGFMSVSCVEKSEKYQTLKAEKEALQIQADNYFQTLEVLNEMEQGFSAIRASEGIIRLEMNDIEKGTVSKKQQMAAEIRLIQERLEDNRAKIDSLEQVLTKNKQSNRALRNTIERMKGELTEKTELVASLTLQLEQKNIRIQELVATVDTLNSNVAGLTDENARQQEMLLKQDADMNRIWYCVATEKELKEANIITKKNIFSSTQVLKKEFNNEQFTATDLRELPEIELQAKKAKLLSTHPEGSYELKEDDQKKLTLLINDPAKFWSLTKYLVVSVSR